MSLRTTRQSEAGGGVEWQPPPGPIPLLDLLSNMRGWKERVETRGGGGEGGMGVAYKEIEVPASLVPRIIHAEQILGFCRVSYENVSSSSSLALASLDAAAVKDSVVLSRDRYRCRHGPEDSREVASKDVTVLKKSNAPSARISKVLTGGSIKVGCRWMIEVIQTMGQKTRGTVTLRLVGSCWGMLAGVPACAA